MFLGFQQKNANYAKNGRRDVINGSNERYGVVEYDSRVKIALPRASVLLTRVSGFQQRNAY